MGVVTTILIGIIIYLIYSINKYTGIYNNIRIHLYDFFINNINTISSLTSDKKTTRKMLEGYIDNYLEYTTNSTNSVKEYQDRITTLYNEYMLTPRFDPTGTLSKESYNELIETII